MIKKLGCLLLIIFILVGCDSTVYEDTNGENDYSLQTLKLDDVFENHSCTQGPSTSKNKLFKYGATEKYTKVNGITDILSFEPVTFGQALYHLELSFHILKGNGAMVIRNFGEILYIIEINKDNQHFEIDATDETVFVTIYGESLDFKFDYEYTIE